MTLPPRPSTTRGDAGGRRFRAATLGPVASARLRPDPRLARARLPGSPRAHDRGRHAGSGPAGARRPGSGSGSSGFVNSDDKPPATEAADAFYSASPVDAATLDPLLTAPVFRGLAVQSSTLARGLAAWTLLAGAVSSEVFGQLGAVPDADALFRVQLRLAGSLFLLPSPVPNALSTSLSTP